MGPRGPVDQDHSDVFSLNQYPIERGLSWLVLKFTGSEQLNLQELFSSLSCKFDRRQTAAASSTESPSRTLTQDTHTHTLRFHQSLADTQLPPAGECGSTSSTNKKSCSQVNHMGWAERCATRK